MVSPVEVLLSRIIRLLPVSQTNHDKHGIGKNAQQGKASHF